MLGKVPLPDLMYMITKAAAHTNGSFIRVRANQLPSQQRKITHLLSNLTHSRVCP